MLIKKKTVQTNHTSGSAVFKSISMISRVQGNNGYLLIYTRYAAGYTCIARMYTTTRRIKYVENACIHRTKSIPEYDGFWWAFV
jgi:glycine/serine hydroxymethyltransferase